MSHYIFKAADLWKRERAYTFDDVLLVPRRSGVMSRFDVSVTSSFTRKKKLEVPFVAANMDTVSEAEMLMAMNAIGAVAIMHRFMTIEAQTAQIKRVQQEWKRNFGALAASVGVNQDSKERARALVDAGIEVLTVDIAHGHSEAMVDMVKYLKAEYSSIEVIAGNVATREATEDLIRVGADAIKVGIGPGSMCTTRIITGVGMPQLTAISLAVSAAKPHGIPVIADGGIRTSGDAMKALAVGASSVMMGNALAGTLETPGELIHGKKVYRGMASRSAQESWRGGALPEGMAPEGETYLVNCKGPARDIIHEYAGGIRSGLSYLNCRDLAELEKAADFVEIGPNCLNENRAHGVGR